MLSTSADTLLTVECAFQSRELRLGIDCAKEDSLELWAASGSRTQPMLDRTCLVHASIGEEKRGVLIRDRARGWHERMLLRLEKVKERLADLRRGELRRRRSHPESRSSSIVQSTRADRCGRQEAAEHATIESNRQRLTSHSRRNSRKERMGSGRSAECGFAVTCPARHAMFELAM